MHIIYLKVFEYEYPTMIPSGIAGSIIDVNLWSRPGMEGLEA